MRNPLADHLAEILGLGVGQVNEGRQVGGVSASWLMLNPDSTSLRFPFACLANKRRKVAIMPVSDSCPDLSRLAHPKESSGIVF
jgi:hypothetical protein